LSLKNLFKYSNIKGFGEFTKYIIIYGRVKWKGKKDLEYKGKQKYLTLY